ncbi:MAG: MCE family protein [Candidatus Competibacteraceae bacterium]|nr:MCE family protein [Candidatus Competibacteraceae bacterium]
MKLTITREVKIAVLVIVSLVVGFWGFNYLKGKDVFKKHREFYAVYNRIDGLGISSPVTVNGFHVGAVTDITLMRNKPGFLLVKFRVSDSALQIPEGTEAKIASSSLLGSKQIQLLLGLSSNYLKPGDTLNTTIEEDLQTSVNKMIAPLKDKVDRLLSNLDSIIVPIQTILDEEGTRKIAESLQRIPRILQNLERTTLRIDTLVAEEKSKLGRIISNVESITANLRKNNDVIGSILENVNEITDSLAKSNFKETIANATSVIGKIDIMMDQINRGEGTLGALLYDDKIYRELENATINLNNLISDIEENPEKYLHFSFIHINRKVTPKDSGKKQKLKD